MRKVKVYIAGPLFTLAERRFNEEFARLLAEENEAFAIILPQADDAAVAPGPDFNRQIYERCMAALDAADVVVAILDGPDADSGTCIEMGYAKAQGKPVLGVRTDFRESQDRGLNIMVAGICTRLVVRSSVDVALADLVHEIAKVLNEELPSRQ